MKPNQTLKRTGLGCAALLALAVLAPPASRASSDMDAPLITLEIAREILSARRPAASVSILAQAPGSSRFVEFLTLGIRHILTGYDHLLFLFGLLIVCRAPRPASRASAHYLLHGCAFLDARAFHFRPGQSAEPLR